MEKATFAAGCFWGVEAEFRRVHGVKNTVVGYSGGTKKNPTAESVSVEFDPNQVSYERLLDVFWSAHDPTTPNGQGPDFGTQYRSVIFYHSPEQERLARESKAALEASGKLGAPVLTEIVPAGPFYPAEEYHQRYLEKRGAASCRIA